MILEPANSLSVPGSYNAWEIGPEENDWSHAAISRTELLLAVPPPPLQETPALVNPNRAISTYCQGDTPIPANDGVGFSVPFVRRTKTGRRAPVCGPPQTFEGCPDILATRLADEGADTDAVDLIRDVIFVGTVTEGALTAPINSRELSFKYGGVKKMWQLLLKVTDIAPGAKNYCCRLCPQERRPEYKNAVDVLRHLKRDHFGMAVACQYW